MFKEQVAEIIRPLLFEDYYPTEVQHQASLDLAQTIVNIFKVDEEQIKKEERERIVDILEEEIKTWYDLARKLRILDLIKTKVCMEGEYNDKKKDAMIKGWGENKHTQKVTEYAGKASDAVQEIRENRRQALSNKEE